MKLEDIRDKEIKGRAEWTDCPCARQQVHVLAVDLTGRPMLLGLYSLKSSTDLYWLNMDVSLCFC